MVRKSKGYRTRSRKKLTKPIRKCGLSPLSRLLHTYEIGDKVLIKIDPSVHKGMPHPRFHGKIGTIMGFRGRALVVQVKDFNKLKTLIIRKEHAYPWGAKNG